MGKMEETKKEHKGGESNLTGNALESTSL